MRSDPASKALFWRNNGPWCETPATAKNPFCNAIASFPSKQVDAYPLDLQHNETMCKMLEGQPNAKLLLDPFTVVRRQGNAFHAIPYNKVYAKEMKQIARHLKRAAHVLDNDEQVFAKYLDGRK